jgi:hypothetical protein
MAKSRFAPFNAAEYLDNEAVIAEYLGAALEDPDPEAFMMARFERRQGARNRQDRQGFRIGTREPVQSACAGRQAAV